MKTRTRAPRGAPEPSWNQARQEWEARVELPDSQQGARRRKWVRAKTEAECREQISRTTLSLADFSVVANGKVTVAQAAEGYLEASRPRVKTGTLATYETRVKLHINPLLGTRPLVKLTTAEVDAWQQALAAKGLAASTRTEIRTTLVLIIEWAQARDLVARNVATLSQGPGTDSEPVECLTKGQAKAVLEAVAGWRYETAVVLMMMLGLRIGEALGLRWVDVDLEAGKLSVQGTLVTKPSLHWQASPKTSSSRRTVDLPQRATAALRLRREAQNQEREALGLRPAEYVFLTETQILIDPSRVGGTLKLLTEALGVKVNPHKLRHTAASLMVDQKVPLETVSKILGHKSIRTTADMYHHLLEGGRAAAASAMDEALG